MLPRSQRIRSIALRTLRLRRACGSLPSHAKNANGSVVMRSAPMIVRHDRASFMQTAPAGAQGLITVRELSLGMALEIAQGALDHCRKLNARIGVSVVDRGGHVLVRCATMVPRITRSNSRNARPIPRGCSARPPVSSSSGSSTIARASARGYDRCARLPRRRAHQVAEGRIGGVASAVRRRAQRRSLWARLLAGVARSRCGAAAYGCAQHRIDARSMFDQPISTFST